MKVLWTDVNVLQVSDAVLAAGVYILHRDSDTGNH